MATPGRVATKGVEHEGPRPGGRAGVGVPPVGGRGTGDPPGLPPDHASLEHTEAGQVAALFRLLGDPGRVRILFALLDAGELCVSDLADAVGSAETSVSHALRLLRTAGVVRHRRSGRKVFYALDDAHVRLLLDLSLAHLRHGEGPGREHEASAPSDPGARWA